MSDSQLQPRRPRTRWRTETLIDVVKRETSLKEKLPSNRRHKKSSVSLMSIFSKRRIAMDEAWRQRCCLAPGTRVQFWRSSVLSRRRALGQSWNPSGRCAHLTDAIARAWCESSYCCHVRGTLGKAIWRNWAEWHRLPSSCLELCKALRATLRVKSLDIHTKLTQQAEIACPSLLPWKAGDVAARECGLEHLDNKDLITAVYRGRTSDEVFEQPFIKRLLVQARQFVTCGVDWVLCVRTYGRSGLMNQKNESGAWIKASSRGIREMTLQALEDVGLTSGWLVDRVHIFVSHEDEHFTSGRYAVALGPAWASRIIVGVKGADLQVRFIEECFHRGQHVVVCDDNLSWIRSCEQSDVIRFRELRKHPCELAELIREACILMQRDGAHLWGLSASSNLMHLKLGRVSKKLGLIYGAFFGFICLHEPSLYTQYGQVKDDLERSLRYWDRDRVIIRQKGFCCKKAHKPGSFQKSKGGISAALGENAHMEEGKKAIESMCSGFARDYARLPLPDDQRCEGGEIKWNTRVSDTGVVFCGNDTAKSSCDPKERVLIAGYSCKKCRKKVWSLFRADAYVFPLCSNLLINSCSTCIDPVASEAKQIFLRDLRDTQRDSECLNEDSWTNLSHRELTKYLKLAASSLKMDMQPKTSEAGKKRPRTSKPRKIYKYARRDATDGIIPNLD